MPDLKFVTDDALRSMVERDKAELDVCLDRGLIKSTLVLSGSIVEAILVDYFLAFPIIGTTSEQILKANLVDLIDWAAHACLISPRTKELSSAIRGWRNLIHPGKEYRLQEQSDIHSATVAKNLVEIIINEVSRNYADKLGYTAEQALAKVQRDPTSRSIFASMVKRMAMIERIKLFRLIPGECKGQESEVVVVNLMYLHELLKKSIPAHVLREEAHKVYELVHNASTEDVTFYFRFFRRNLYALEEEPRQTVLIYLLNLLSQSNHDYLEQWSLWGLFDDIGVLLNNDDGAKLLAQTATQRLFSGIADGDEDFVSVLNVILLDLADEHMFVLHNALNPYKEGARVAAWLDALADYLLEYSTDRNE